MNDETRAINWVLQKRMKKRTILPSLILSVVCAALLILSRSGTSTVFIIGGVVFAYTDLLVIIPAGIGGPGCGICTYMILFFAEIIRAGGEFATIYSLFVYLLIIMMTALISYLGLLRKLWMTLLSGTAVSFMLAVFWYISYTVLLPSIANSNVYTGVNLLSLFISAFPEVMLSFLIMYLYFRFAPDRIKTLTEYGWVYSAGRGSDRRRFQKLGKRITALFLVEALALCAAAIISNLLFDQENGAGVTADIIHKSFRLGMIMMSAAIPIAYFFNHLLLVYVVRPINSMSFLMDRYFETPEIERKNTLPELDIKSGDEVERLYHSLRKMTVDMGEYIERELEQERKSAHLTKGFMLALAKAVDAKDRYTSGHSTRVAEYSREIAKRMGKDDKEQEEIYTMGLLHDIGKIGVPESIINKNGRLTDEEYAKIKEHPVTGNEILKNVTELPMLATGARWHHERYDGKGYPDHLKGEDIPQEARIIAVADAYDAMTSKRAYSDIRPQQEVRAEIIRCKGTQFDPEIAEIILNMIDDDKEYTMHE